MVSKTTRLSPVRILFRNSCSTSDVAQLSLHDCPDEADTCRLKHKGIARFDEQMA